jgi:hypothetical protein
MTHNLPQPSYCLLPVQLPVPPTRTIASLQERAPVRAATQYPSAVTSGQGNDKIVRTKLVKLL